MKTLRTLTILLTVCILVACVGTIVNPDVPPEIVYGEDVCDRCGQIIDDERFAASMVTETAYNTFEYLVFDDISEMLHYTMEHGSLEVARYYVHDYKTAEWLDAHDAYFVKSGGMVTPTSFGLVAFANQLEAELVARKWDGDVLTFPELNTVLYNSIAEFSTGTNVALLPN